MATVHVANQYGTVIDGAIVQVYAPGALAGVLGGYNATAATNSEGNASFPAPNVSNLPVGSSADVIVNWTDPSTGINYAGEGNWGTEGLFGLSIDEDFTPDPLNIQLVTDLTINQEGGGGIPTAEIYEILEIVGIVFVVLVGGVIIYTVAKDLGVSKDIFQAPPNYAATEA